MTLEDILKLLSPSNRLRIIKDEKDAWIGWLGNFGIIAHGLTGKEEVDSLQAIPEIRHKKWEEKGLMKPIEPEEAAQYSFSDLEMKLYYTIYLK